ncbi:MAG TPA: hypothetical protein VG325_14225 [Solirubrobacteraceae bacterium]|jgi:hypothetical protein|nr:hypothetical protein [Solirubrobacteraceae bacterium]
MTQARTAVAVACASLIAAACGAPPPQAPVAQASIISGALTTIAASCGEAYRLEAFTPHPDLTGLESTAGASAGKLARISSRHPGWIYQGDTLAKIDTLSVQSLRACSLTRAARPLERLATG